MAAGIRNPKTSVNAPPPNIAALYLQHRDAMYRVAASVLRGTGRESDTEDVVQEAILSIMDSPPTGVQNWEALLVTVARRRALDKLKSAHVRHAGGELEDVHDALILRDDFAEDVIEAVDLQRRAAIAWDCLAVLDERHRIAVWGVVALERPRDEVAAELGVTPGRVSQMVKNGLKILEDEILRKERT
jgi:RNA polymerase sigma factor (sigma-70 family)